MNISRYLEAAGVPPTLWSEAQASIDASRKATGGTFGALMWRKH